MKFILPFFLFFNVNGAQLASFTECSDPSANVIYQQLENEEFLFVTTINTSTGQHEKIKLQDYQITPLSKTYLGTNYVLTCQENIVQMKEELNYRKIRIEALNALSFPGNIVGVSEDKTFIPVDYICKTTTISQCD